MHYKKLNIDNFQSIQDKIVPYIVDFVTADINASEEKLFYNLISDENLIRFKEDLPELFESVRRHLGSDVILMSYIYVDGIEEIPIHIDGGVNCSVKIRTRLNWPILNGESAETIFYEKNDENVVSKIHSYKSGVAGHTYDPKDCYEVDRYILNVPTLMNVRQLHGIEILDHKLPRILLSMRLSNEEEVYQKYF